MSVIALLKEIGSKTEKEAHSILLERFDDVKWVSKKKPTAPYDFICDEIKVDAKSCLYGRIFISKRKMQRLKDGEFGAFYYMLKINNTEFCFMSFEDLLENKDFEIHSDKFLSECRTIRVYMKDELYPKFLERKKEIVKKINELVEKELKRKD